MVFPGYLVKGLEVYAEVETSVFLMDENYWRSVQGAGQADKSDLEMLVKEFSESLEFCLGEGIDRTMQRCLSFF